MLLYLVRHADAVAVGEDGVTTDAERHLSPKGLRQAAKVALFLRDHAEAPDAIVSSPLLRSVQTAEQIAGVVAPGAKVTAMRELAPGTAPAAVFDAICRRKRQSIIAVGHMPDLALLSGVLLTGTACEFLDFGKAATAAFDLSTPTEPAAAKLLWFVRPRLVG
jgi:phosphohistidine phosphatase